LVAPLRELPGSQDVVSTPGNRDSRERPKRGVLAVAALPTHLHDWPTIERRGAVRHGSNYDFERGSRGFRGERAKEQRCVLSVDAGTIALDE
jgi:hypothetical protein